VEFEVGSLEMMHQKLMMILHHEEMNETVIDMVIDMVIDQFLEVHQAQMTVIVNLITCRVLRIIIKLMVNIVKNMDYIISGEIFMDSNEMKK
jgi:hypothetical protein